MKIERAVIAAAGIEVPPQVVTSLEIEERLAPLYGRLGLVPGRLEMMTGIKSRRFWPSPIRPSEIAARAGAKAIAASGIDRRKIGLLIHGSVCRDFLEPATASVVHHKLELAPSCKAFDLSNACLGVLDGIALCAQLIDAGRIEAGLVVSGEDGKPLLEKTIESLLADPKPTRKSIKPAFASLTIGAGGVAILLADKKFAPNAPRIAGFVQHTASEHHSLCQGGGSSEGMEMATDAEALLQAGIELATQTWAEFKSVLSWDKVDRTIPHQVGRAHTRSLYQALGIDEATAFLTFEELGNVGSAALPMSWALAQEKGFIQRGDRVALLGIGSGLQTLSMGIEA